jgi:hypothetical protein
MNGFDRLSTISPELASELRAQSPTAQRQISRSISVWIAGEVGLEDPRISAGLQALTQQNATTLETVDAVKMVVDELDEAAWDMQDQVDVGLRSGDEFDIVFARSRAATAVWYAFNPDPLVAALESAYEAQAASDLDALLTVIRSVTHP